MPKVKIDNNEYELSELSSVARSSLSNMQFVDGELNRLRFHLKAMKDTRDYFAITLNEMLKTYKITLN